MHAEYYKKFEEAGVEEFKRKLEAGLYARRRAKAAKYWLDLHERSERMTERAAKAFLAVNGTKPSSKELRKKTRRNLRNLTKITTGWSMSPTFRATREVHVCAMVRPKQKTIRL